MKILFVENRFRTVFWRAIAQKMREDGHEVRFIIQNHFFSANKHNEYIIPYPKGLKGDTKDSWAIPLIESDRNINYFGHKGTAHYAYYREKIEEIIENFDPVIVFGESTAFHELITIEICKVKSILYLQPSTTRYPVGRFSFYMYDTLIPYKGSGQIMDADVAMTTVASITHRTIVPDYMKKKKSSLASKVNRVKDLCKHTFSFIGGEHYNTPNPMIKRKIERRKERIIERWDKLAAQRQHLMDKNNFKLLYPLQMQPEANVDVWGRKYRRQLNTIKLLSDNSSSDCLIVVKPNPKSKYELTEEMLDYIESNPRIVPIVHKMSMDSVLGYINFVVTVTGTIAIECILSNKPIVTLVNTLNNTSRNCIYMENWDDLKEHIEKVRASTFPRIGIEEKCNFINLLNSTGFEGIPYESNLVQSNIEICYKGFKTILSSLGNE